jgi:saccharopine dehydrogenase-like NADP-dependent oxidoreductase
MRVVVEGVLGGEPRRFAWDLLDRYDERTGLRSMSRTTAFPATQVARLLADGSFRRPGVQPPEVLGAVPGVLDRVLAGLEARGVRTRLRQERLAAAAADPASESRLVGVG